MIRLLVLSGLNVTTRRTSASTSKASSINMTLPCVFILTHGLLEEGSKQIKELCYDNGRWARGSILPAAVRGTSIATILCQPDRLDIRVYYQAEDLSIREHVYDLRKGWSPGEPMFFHSHIILA